MCPLWTNKIIREEQIMTERQFKGTSLAEVLTEFDEKTHSDSRSERRADMSEATPNIIPQAYPLKAYKENGNQAYLIVGWIVDGDKLIPLGVETSRSLGRSLYTSNRPVRITGKVDYAVPTQWTADVNS